MMADRSSHGGMLPIGDAKLFGGLSHNPCELRIVSVADERAQMMRNMMVQPADEPTYDRVTRRIIGCCRKDVIDTVVKLAAIRREVGAVNRVRRLEYQRYRQTDNHVNEYKCPRDQERRSPQNNHRQNEHVRDVENLPRKED